MCLATTCHFKSLSPTSPPSWILHPCLTLSFNLFLDWMLHAVYYEIKQGKEEWVQETRMLWTQTHGLHPAPREEECWRLWLKCPLKKLCMYLSFRGWKTNCWTTSQGPCSPLLKHNVDSRVLSLASHTSWKWHHMDSQLLSQHQSRQGAVISPDQRYSAALCSNRISVI